MPSFRITAYSATNPNANRFDVIRIKFDSNSSICPRVSIDNQYVADHSWFPPHAWCFAVCQNCRSHLGWCFQAPPRSPSDETPSEDHSSPSDVKRQRIAGGGGGGASVDNETVGVPNEELRDNVETAVTTARYDVDDTDPTADKDTPQTEGTQRDSTSTKQSTESQKFLGLIVTKLRPSKISVPDFQQRERHARRGEGQQRLTWRERMSAFVWVCVGVGRYLCAVSNSGCILVANSQCASEKPFYVIWRKTTTIKLTIATTSLMPMPRTLITTKWTIITIVLAISRLRARGVSGWCECLPPYVYPLTMHTFLQVGFATLRQTLSSSMSANMTQAMRKESTTRWSQARQMSNECTGGCNYLTNIN